MRRLFVVLVVVIFFSGGILTLVGLGNYFISYVSSQGRLSVEKSSHQVLPLGTKATFKLQGKGFNRQTTASLLIDVSSSEAIIGSIPLEGIFNDSLLYGDYLYLASSSGGLQVLDIKEPDQPRLFKEYLVGRSIFDIYRKGEYLYLCCKSLGVSIMQIQPDGTLRHITDIAVESLAVSCQVFHGFLFIAGGKSGLLVYDVRQPKQPRLVQIVRTGSFVSKVVMSGAFLYLAVAENQIDIYKLQTPQMPFLAGSLQLSEKVYDLIVDRKDLYVASEAGISLYSLAVPLKPVLSQQWPDFGSARRLFSGLGHIYVSDSFSGLRSVATGEQGTSPLINLNIDPRALSETPDYLYVAGSNKGLLVVDKRKLLQRQLLPEINTSGSAQDLFIKNNWLYIADARGGVLLHNLGDQSNDLKTVSSWWGESFAVQNDFLFVAQASQGIEVLDISDPGKPAFVALWAHLTSKRLAIFGHYLLSSNGVSGLDLIDFAEMRHPVIKHLLSDVHVMDVTTEGKFIYIASKDGGLLVYKLIDNDKLSRLSSLQTPFPMNQFDHAVTVQVHDGVAYLANGRSGLLIVDVSKPTKPVILASVAIPGFCKTLHVIGNTAYVISHPDGISLINIKNPKKPILMSSISIAGLSRGLQVDDDLIYVAQKERGVAVIPMPTQAEKIKLLSKQRMQVTLPSPKFPGNYSLQINNQRELIVVDGVVIYQKI